jgi:homoserine O-acetyltransferase/O-succinyltransferase
MVFANRSCVPSISMSKTNEQSWQFRDGPCLKNERDVLRKPALEIPNRPKIPEQEQPALGIKRLHAILGISMGGMNAWQWAEAYPDDVEGVMPVVSLPSKIAGRNAIWRHLATNMIEQDPAYKSGDYTGPFPGFIHAYQLLFMMIDGVPYLQATTPDWPAAAKFLDNLDRQGEATDPNDLVYSLKSSGDYDPEPGLSRIKAKLFALNFGDDEFNPDELGILQRLTPKVAHGRYVVQPGSATSFGHLTMAHPELWADHVATFMQELDGNTH